MDRENVFGQQKPELPFERTPIIGKYIKDLAEKINRTTATEGLSKGIRHFVEQKGGRVTAQYDNPITADYLHKTGQPLIVVATHSSLAQPLVVLASLSADTQNPRDDIVVIVADGLPQYPNLNAHFMPLYNTAPTRGFRPDTTIFKSLGGRALHTDRKTATSFNKSSLQKSAEELRNGKLIFISPEGNMPKDSPWSPAGIGRLITDIGTGSNGYIVFADAQGAGILEMAKFLNPLVKPQPFKNVKVRFSQLISIDSIIKEGANQKLAITTALNSHYNNWARNQP